MEEGEEGGGKHGGKGKGAKGGMERKARSLRIMCQLSLGKVSSAPNGTTGSFSMKSLICWNSPQCNGEGSDRGGGRRGKEVQKGQVISETSDKGS